jgi:integrase
LLTAKAQRSGKPISKATAHHTLQAIQEFLAWLHGRPRYRRSIDTADIAYLNLTTKDERAAHVSAPKAYASLEQYRAALFAIPTGSDVECRDRALMAFLLLTGMRDAAVVGLKLKHISIERGHVFQDPREVSTKFNKAIETFFFPVGEDVAAIVTEWVNLLTRDRFVQPA